MLSILAARLPVPAEEPQDRDPGFITLAFTVVRALRRGGRDAFARHRERPRQTPPRG